MELVTPALPDTTPTVVNRECFCTDFRFSSLLLTFPLVTLRLMRLRLERGSKPTSRRWFPTPVPPFRVRAVALYINFW